MTSMRRLVFVAEVRRGIGTKSMEPLLSESSKQKVEDADAFKEELEPDDFSDVFDNSDMFHVEVDEARDYVTVEDKDLQYIEELKEHLDVDSGIWM